MWAIVIALIGLWSVTLRPVSLGGPATMVGVDGTSMTPTMHDGDVAFTRTQDSYAVGDVVAYHVPDDAPGGGIDVIHRIVGGDEATGYEMRGDHNDLDDAWHPHRSDIVGKVVFRIPNAAELFQTVLSPQAIAAFVGFILFVVAVWPADRSRQPIATR